MKMKRNASLKNVLDFTEEFLSNQLDDFSNWCDEIMMSMPDEEDVVNNVIPGEDNPS